MRGEEVARKRHRNLWRILSDSQSLLTLFYDWIVLISISFEPLDLYFTYSMQLYKVKSVPNISTLSLFLWFLWVGLVMVDWYCTAKQVLQIERERERGRRLKKVNIYKNRGFLSFAMFGSQILLQPFLSVFQLFPNPEILKQPLLLSSATSSARPTLFFKTPQHFSFNCCLLVFSSACFVGK